MLFIHRFLRVSICRNIPIQVNINCLNAYNFITHELNESRFSFFLYNDKNCNWAKINLTVNTQKKKTIKFLSKLCIFNRNRKIKKIKYGLKPVDNLTTNIRFNINIINVMYFIFYNLLFKNFAFQDVYLYYYFLFFIYLFILLYYFILYIYM